MQAFGYAAGALPGLPDPDLDRQFYSGVPTRRFFAWCIDFVLELVIGIPIAIFFGIATLGFGFLLFGVMLAVISFLYRVTTISNRSATWGMRIMGIELRRADGERFDFGTALLHTSLFTVSVAFVVLQLISCLSMVGSRYGQGLPDLILRTTMINRPED